MRLWGWNVNLTEVLLECIARHGVHEINLDMVARKAGISRAYLYRQFGRRGVFAHAHTEVLEGIDQLFPAHLGGALRIWWEAASALLRRPPGRAFRALRGLVAENGCEELALSEVARLPTLIRAVDCALRRRDDPIAKEDGFRFMTPLRPEQATVVAHQIWVLLLGELAYAPGSAEAAAFWRAAEALLPEKAMPVADDTAPPCSGLGLH